MAIAYVNSGSNTGTKRKEINPFGTIDQGDNTSASVGSLTTNGTVTVYIDVTAILQKAS